MLSVAAILCFLIGLVHSILGEFFILIRLLRESRLPRLFGSEVFTRRTLRFAWHLTTFAWWGLGYLLWVVARDPVNLAATVLATVSTVFFVSGTVALLASRGKHLSWLVFWAIAALTTYVRWTGQG